MSYSDPVKQRAYQREYNRRRRDAWLQANGPCALCGSWADPEVDHKDRTTKVDHKVWSWSKPRREAELAKCQVLCTSCHKMKTATENQKPITHGTRGGYSRGCRCSLCCGHQAARMARYHENNPR